MKVWVILGVLCLSGCGSFVTMEELERQAALSGDWSAVEKRERIIAKRRARRGPSCPRGLVAACEHRAGDIRCSCVDRHAVMALIPGIN